MKKLRWIIYFLPIVFAFLAFRYYKFKKEYNFVAASDSGKILIVKDCLSSGVDVNSRAYKGLSAIDAAAYKGHTEIVLLLLKKGANPDTALYKAILMKREDIVRILLEHGANPDRISDSYSETPLQFANSLNTSKEITTLLKNNSSLYK